MARLDALGILSLLRFHPARDSLTPSRLTEPVHMAGPVVKEIQRALKAAGFSPGPIDGDFGANTHTAVMAFQASLGLVADGEVGPQTAKKLGITLPNA